MNDYYLPIHHEYNLCKLTIEGKIPHDLNGILYRNGPNPIFYPKNHHHHLFDGDGMVHAFYINSVCSQSIYYSNKWIKTERFKIENRNNKAVFGGLLDTPKTKLNFNMINKAYNTSNTNLLYFNRNLYSLWEFGLPYKIDPFTLSTLNQSHLNRDYNLGAFTAHPKIDPITGELLAVSYNGDENLPACHVTITSHLNETKLNVDVKTPYRSMMHDFAFTKEYIVIPVFPAIIDFSGRSPHIINWNPSGLSYVGILPRNSTNGEVKHWFTLPSCFVYHFVNAYQNQRHQIILDAVVNDIVPLFVTENNQIKNPSYSRLIRWIFDLENKTYHEFLLDESNLFYHFPHCYQNLLGQIYDTVYAYVQDSNIHQIIKLNLTTKKKLIYCGKEHFALSEPICIATTSGEYILVIETSYIFNQSSLLIFDTNNLITPIVIAKLPERIPCGFHGLWLDS